MPKYLVTLNERIARTYSVEATDPVDAIQEAKSLVDPDMHEVAAEWVDWVGEPDPDYDVELENEGTPEHGVVAPVTTPPLLIPTEDIPDEDF